MDVLLWVASAYAGGVFTAFLPCTFPVVLGYIGLLVSLGIQSVGRKIFILTLFTLGFSSVFAALGFAAGLAGSYAALGFAAESTPLFSLSFLRELFPFIMSAVFFLFAGMMFRVIPTPIFHTLKVPMGGLGAVSIGALFALGWSPCIGPVLGALLTLSANAHTALSGTVLLGVFSFGLMTPLLALIFFQKGIVGFISRNQFVLRAAECMFGCAFLFIGLWFLFPSLFPWIGGILSISIPFLDDIQSGFKVPSLFV